ncbi:hypothetical protein [Haloplasma contractile]|uniref:Uncharacterized protein n=1 Tax=Haloplasma contractile SSD-17B TaxID=1033810 RepID=U2E7V9_9MOLU|nr:hypothetical protein [Haloplasma contractile]ERJ11283.1 hypothetical protein HLPCO_002723 [Haloplasma contractile SSD-17B]
MFKYRFRWLGRTLFKFRILNSCYYVEDGIIMKRQRRINLYR